MKTTADAVVIGGGVVGAAIAYNLAKYGLKNIVLCEKDTFASGSTGRCGAGVREQWGAEGNIRMCKAAIDIFENLQEELEYDYDIEFVQKGYLMLAYIEKEWEQFNVNIKVQHKLGVNAVALTPQEAREIVPTLNTEGLYGATFNARDGHANPFHTTRAYLKAFERLGGEVCFFTEVTGIEKTNGRIQGVKTTKGDISAPVVVNAAGPWAAPVASMVGVDLPVYTERHQILVTEPVGRLFDPMLMSFSRGFYSQQTPHGSVVMGIGDPNEPKGYDIGHSWQFLRRMCDIMCSVVPALEGVRVVRQWSGLYTISPDAHPILGTVPGIDGYYHAVGFSGHGFMLAPIVGKVIAEMILDKELSIDISGLDLGRFERGDLRVEPSVV
ncbi:MAG: NAD(P)/FAD-dependent oxidoreductase [Bacillota bacterium]|jgi:sarcosine oxidase subunit beta|nr:FAD-binding oxidoreductase [Candidatus Fermentithermobacillaceae bacterium]